MEQEYLSMHSIKIQKIYSCLLFVGTEVKDLFRLYNELGWVGLVVCLLACSLTQRRHKCTSQSTPFKDGFSRQKEKKNNLYSKHTKIDWFLRFLSFLFLSGFPILYHFLSPHTRIALNLLFLWFLSCAF